MASAIAPPTAPSQPQDVESQQSRNPPLTWQGKCIRWGAVTGGSVIAVLLVAAAIFEQISPTESNAATAGLVIGAVVILGCGGSWYRAAPQLDESRRVTLMQRESDEAKATLARQTAEIARLQQLVEANKKNIATEGDVLKEITKETNDSSAALEELKDTVQAITKESSVKTAEIERLRDVIKKLVAAFNKTNLTSLKLSADELLKVPETLGENSKAFDKITDDFESVAAAMAKSSEAASAELTKKTEELAALESQLPILEGKIAERTAHLEEQNRLKKEIDDQLKQKAAKYEEARKSFKSLLKELADAVTPLKDKNDAVKTFVDLANDESTKLEPISGAFKAAIAFLKTTVA